ncbi:MAG TPA: hypothetical protein GXZ24_05270 [Firmicutes bacterium]|nr:hypothetical protein [Bacillota bacterium]
MRLRLLLKLLIICLAMVMAGGTTMAWYSLQIKKTAGEGDVGAGPVFTVNKNGAQKIITMNRNKADWNNIRFCVADTNGIETPYHQAEYAAASAIQPADMPPWPEAIESGEECDLRRISKSPPIRAGPEPRGPL